MMSTTRLVFRSATSSSGVVAKKLWAVQSRGWRSGREGASKWIGHWSLSAHLRVSSIATGAGFAPP
jgi:hypothetical protein